MIFVWSSTFHTRSVSDGCGGYKNKRRKGRIDRNGKDIPKFRTTLFISCTNPAILSSMTLPRQAPSPSRIGLKLSLPPFRVLNFEWRISLHLSNRFVCVTFTLSWNSLRSISASLPPCWILDSALGLWISILVRDDWFKGEYVLAIWKPQGLIHDERQDEQDAESNGPFSFICSGTITCPHHLSPFLQNFFDSFLLR